MKTLNNNVILYDSNCPLCKAYTGTFVACGLLDRNGRSAYNEQDPALFHLINQQKARNEIALVDTSAKTVTYGIDSLIKILGHGRPLISGLLNFPLVYYPSKFFYALVSYNRKMIAPSKTKDDACVPDFNWFYRVMYLFLATIFTGFILCWFITPILQHSGLRTGLDQEMIIVSTQLIFQSAMVWFVYRRNIFDYLGNLMTVSMIGALLLLPAIILYQTAGFNFYFALFGFSVVVSSMFLLHVRRCKKLGLGLGVSFSWAFYRILVLIIIFSIS